VPRNDPTDTGGLFIGRRPGTAPLKYRTDPNRDPRRQRSDGLMANVLFVVIVFVVLTAWGPQPMAWMWVGSQVDYHTGSLMLGITVSFMGLLASLIVTLSITTRLDGAWRILRRASGREQKDGVLARIWLWTAIFAGAAFIFWFLIIAGPGPSFAPSG
jgi:hypothetical protein